MDYLPTIGFSVADIDAYQVLAETVFDRGVGHRAGENFYVQYKDGSGAELWLQVDLKSSFVGMNPYFDSQVGLKMTLERPILRYEGTMDGAFVGRLEPSGMQVVFDMPDAHLLPAFRLPAPAHVRLCGFASGPLRATDEEETSLQMPTDPLHDAHARIRARVAKSALRMNQNTKQAFHWAELELPDGNLEVVAAVDQVAEGLLKPGTWVVGSFWLSGRVQVAPEAQAQSGFIQRVFWGA